jgi:hypothetical protein
MIYIIGGIVSIIGFIQLYRLLRNSKRPKTDGKIEKLMDQHLKQDKAKKFRTQPHARVSFYVDGKLCKADILFKDKEKQVDETVTLTYDPNKPKEVEMFVFKAEFMMSSIIILIGFVIMGISHFIMSYFDLW